MDVCSYNFWFYCTLLDPRFKSFRNILGLTATDKTEARASFDSLYRSHWAKDMELSCDSDGTEDMDAPEVAPPRNETAVCGRRSHVNLMAFQSQKQLN